MDMLSILALLLFVVAFISGILTWISKNVWQDRLGTSVFAALGIASTIAFVGLVLVVMP